MRDGLLDVLVITEGAPFDADPLLAVFEADPGVQWMQAGNDFEYMIKGCDRTFREIRSSDS